MKEALSSSEKSVLTRATRRNITEDTILHSHRRENLKSYISSSYLTHLSRFHQKTEKIQPPKVRFSDKRKDDG
jgi:hypothetical protein